MTCRSAVRTDDHADRAMAGLTTMAQFLIRILFVNSDAQRRWHRGRCVAHCIALSECHSRLFEERFCSSLIDGDRYLLAYRRSIAINPVDTGIVGARGAYPW